MKDKTERHIKKGWLAASACLVILIAVLLVRISAGPGKAAEAETGPQDVLSGFYSALISGKTDRLAAYCDTTSGVREYVDSFVSRTAVLRESEPGALAIAAGMVRPEITGKHKDRDGVLLDFRLVLKGKTPGQESEDSPQQVKERTARLKMEEGRWVITDITGR